MLALATTTSLAPGVSLAARERVVFSISEGVSAEDEALVREGIGFAQAYFAATLGARVDDRLFINARATVSPNGPENVGQSAAHWIVVYTGSEVWQENPPFNRLRVLVHELVHVLQREYLRDLEGVSPLWLEEGIAEYLSSEAVVAAGLVDWADLDALSASSVVLGPGLPPLAALEARASWLTQPANAYDLAYLAVQHLLQERGTPAIRRYYERLATGASWRAAFKSAFRVGPDEFYQRFEASRAEFVAADGPPAAFAEFLPAYYVAAVALAAVPATANRGETMTVIAATGAGARCDLVVTDRTARRVYARPAVADGRGLVFWLWTIPDETRRGTATATAECGGAPAVSALRIR
jgi:hypothetical protein